MRLPVRSFWSLAARPSSMSAKICSKSPPSTSAASLERIFSSTGATCSSCSPAVHLRRPFSSWRALAAAPPAQPFAGGLAFSACESCSLLQNKGMHVSSFGNHGINPASAQKFLSFSSASAQKFFCVCSASAQKPFCHGCSLCGMQLISDRFGASLHTCSFGEGKLAEASSASRASWQRGFSHGNAENPGSGSHSQEYNADKEEEMQANKAGGAFEGTDKEAGVVRDASASVALSDSMDDALSKEKASPSSPVLKKYGAMKNISERRRGLFSRHSQEKIADLLTVPGIGPRNMEKLVAKGIGGVAELKQLYLDKFRSDGKDKMIEYLQTSVGIIHKHHAMSITTYIKDTVEKELNSEDILSSDAASKRRLTFCVEGNISVGKTTFLHRVTNEAIELRDLVEIVSEPVAKWQDIGPEHFNILDAFYAEPQRYAYTFQNYVFITRLMQEQESAGGLKPLRLMERSVFSDRMVFVRAVHEAKWMNEMEISIYDSWFNPVVSVLPGLVPDGFIYLRASPDTCHKRLQMRKRPEEQSVTLEYLRALHEKHEQWLFPSSINNEGIFSVTRPSHLIEPLPSTLQDRVYYLQGEHVHSSLQKVPALILDCEANIDFTRDLEAKAAYARQVSEFFEYVRRSKELEQKAESVAAKGVLPRGLLVPRSNGLFMPNGTRLNSRPLMPMDLKQQPSSLWK